MTLAERIAAVLSEKGGNPLHLPFSEQWRIPDVAEKIAQLITREEVMPTEPTIHSTVDTPPPSARSQAGAFVPTAEMCAGMARRIREVPNVWHRFNKAADLPYEVCRYGRSDEPEIVVMASCRTQEIANETQGEMIDRLRADAVFAYAQEVFETDSTSVFMAGRDFERTARAPSPVEPPAATVEQIAEVLVRRTNPTWSAWARATAREIAALRPAPAVPEEITAQIAYALEMSYKSSHWNDDMREGAKAVADFLTASFARNPKPTAPKAALPPEVAALVERARQIWRQIDNAGSRESDMENGYEDAVVFVRDLAALR